MSVDFVIKENSSCFLDISFKDENGLPVVPDTANYTVHDLGSGDELQPSTLMPSTSDVTIEILPTVNLMVDPNHTEEIRVVTIITSYSSGGGDSEEYMYKVKNLRFAP